MVGVSVIVPVKPPEPYLPTLKQRIQHALCGTPHEILVQTEKGLAYAVKCGVEKAKFPVVAVLDADGSHPPEELPSMIRKLREGFDVVVGSRYVEGGESRDSFFRRFVSKCFCWLSREMLGLKVRDPMSGFVVARKYVFKESLKYCVGFKFTLEVLSNPKYRVYEHPIVFEKRKAGNPKSNVKVGFQTLWLIFKLWWRRRTS